MPTAHLFRAPRSPTKRSMPSRAVPPSAAETKCADDSREGGEKHVAFVSGVASSPAAHEAHDL
ncbi:hypothetical protein PybrP1_007549 [[Pythium] brassicae (nom. inval.)]|nr:hypothetical protein PybrP1_007549 [[Pythium] brassicae (nom. inval.)]